MPTGSGFCGDSDCFSTPAEKSLDSLVYGEVPSWDPVLLPPLLNVGSKRLGLLV
jgi:hypothetical protein